MKRSHARSAVILKATSYGRDATGAIVMSGDTWVRIPRGDAMRLVGVLMSGQKKHALVNLRAMAKDYKELATLRRVVASRSRAPRARQSRARVETIELPRAVRRMQLEGRGP